MLVLVLLKLLCFQRLPNQRESIGKKLRAGKETQWVWCQTAQMKLKRFRLPRLLSQGSAAVFLLAQEIFEARSGNSINWPKKVLKRRSEVKKRMESKRSRVQNPNQAKRLHKNARERKKQIKQGCHHKIHGFRVVILQVLFFTFPNR